MIYVWTQAETVDRLLPPSTISYSRIAIRTGNSTVQQMTALIWREQSQRR